MMSFRAYINEAQKTSIDEMNAARQQLENKGYVLAPYNDKKPNLIVALCNDGKRKTLFDKIAKEKDIGIARVENKKTPESSLGRITLKNGIKIVIKNAGADGNIKRNKGNAFEDVFHNALVNFINDEPIQDLGSADAIDEIVTQYIPKGYVIVNARQVGALNNHRPMFLDDSGKTMYCGNGDGDIGKTVADEIIEISNGTSKKEIYLSLKSESKVTFSGIGLGSIINKDEIRSGKITSKKGLNFLNFLGLDNERFCSVFNNYIVDIDPQTGLTRRGRKSEKAIVNVTSQYKSKAIELMLHSMLGYGYLLVHKQGSKVIVKDMTKTKRDAITKVKKAEIHYPTDGKAKRIDIIIECEGISLSLNIRSKSANEVFPSHLNCDLYLSKTNRSLLGY